MLRAARLLLLTLLFIAPAAAQQTRVADDDGGTVAVRGEILHLTDDPFLKGDGAIQHFEDGVLLVEKGKIRAVGPAEEILARLPEGTRVEHYPTGMIVPGFVDTHIHYPQTEMIGAFGEQLLEWLQTYTFPTEKQFADEAHARRVSQVFLGELLRNGTTTALVFATVHPISAEVLFQEAEQLRMRIVAGKVMMDRNAPDYLLDTAESSYTETKALIERWHEKPGTRLLYAVTPRFAPTSTPEQLTAAGKLLKEFPSVYMHTHISENQGEVAWVKELFPERSGYLDVYDHYGLTGKRSMFAHAIHLTDAEWARMAETDSAISFCPTSNLFLGSGLFQLGKSYEAGVKVGLGTDVGAGTSFSMLQTLNEAYKVIQLQSQKLSAFHGLYLATLGSARALELDDKIGSLQEGREADFVILDTEGTSPLMKFRLEHSRDLHDKLFVLMTLGDDRAVRATYVDGHKVHDRDEAPIDLVTEQPSPARGPGIKDALGD